MKSEHRRTPTLGNSFERRVVPQTTTEDIPDLYEFAPGIGLTRVPEVTLDEDQLSRLALDRPTRRLLALVDGAFSFAVILQVSDLPVLDALTACRRLLQRGVISVTA